MEENKKARVIAIGIQKGGTGKTQTSVNLASGLARKGKKVLVIDADPQSSLTVSLGWQRPDLLELTLVDVMEKTMNREVVEMDDGILHHKEGMDVLPCNLRLAEMDLKLIGVMRREYILKRYIDRIREAYDYIIIDCPPSMGLISLNIFTACDSVLIPVEMSYLAMSGLELLMSTLSQVKEELNPALEIEGILVTKYNARTINAQVVYEALEQSYRDNIPFFSVEIPEGVKAKEAPIRGCSIFEHAPNCKVARAYEKVEEEVLSHE